MATPAQAATDVFSCAQCGAPTTFDPGTTRLICDHCGNAAEIVLATHAIPTHDLFGKAAITSLHATDLTKSAREIACKQCGAHAIVTRRAERCAFCDAAMVVEVEQSDPAIPPGGVLPFAIPGKDAAARFGEWLSGRWFAPGDLVQRSKRDRLDGVYLPFWAFDAKSTTQYDGQRGTVRYETETYKDANGQEQTRQVEHVTWVSASGTVHFMSKDVLIGASATLPVKLVHQLEPWELPKLRAFDPRLLAGFAAERYQMQPADSFIAAYPTIEGQIRGAINRDIGGDRQKIDSMTVNWDAVGFRHLLLPIWLSSFRYNEKVFHVAVNAATGEVVGERPWSVPKIVMFVAAIVAIVAAIIVAITFLVTNHR
jgi:DNA-directed RNA polymerase subunit RPC12/RpoP